MCASKADGAAFSVMVGVGETYLPAFVLAGVPIDQLWLCAWRFVF
jgi:hypothetical protein